MKFVALGFFLTVCLAIITTQVFAAVYDIEKEGAVADKDEIDTMFANTHVINATFAKLVPGDTLLVPNKTFNIFGGIYATGLRNVTFQVDGTLRYSTNRKKWPRHPDNSVYNCIQFDDLEDFTLTSSGRGTFDGQGEEWWGAINYLIHKENRPKLLQVNSGARILVENILFKNSPYWNTDFNDISDVTIRYCEVSARYSKNSHQHGIREIQAFNTDGFDLSGQNVHIHDCTIWNDDDCIAVKDVGNGGKHARCSENWLVERMNVSGVGLTIGSIGASANGTCIRNITFRDTIQVNPFKGIYLKSRSASPGTSCVIEDILYENITITNPTQWAIWIGPAQQADSSNVCSLLWPQDPFAKCPISNAYDWRNITLKDITIIDPKTSPGVIIGNNTNPMDIIFDNVVVQGDASKAPFFAEHYACYGVNGTATGGTNPIPICFNNGRQCLEDGVCRDAEGTPCCSGEHHDTLECIRGRCGQK